jgi:hypothetical protein
VLQLADDADVKAARLSLKTAHRHPSTELIDAEQVANPKHKP